MTEFNCQIEQSIKHLDLEKGALVEAASQVDKMLSQLKEIGMQARKRMSLLGIPCQQESESKSELHLLLEEPVVVKPVGPSLRVVQRGRDARVLMVQIRKLDRQQQYNSRHTETESSLIKQLREGKSA